MRLKYTIYLFFIFIFAGNAYGGETLQDRVMEIYSQLMSLHTVSTELDTPKIVFCGQQSSGKTSTVNRFLGINLPVKDGMATKVPFFIHCEEGYNEEVIVKIRAPSKSTNYIAVDSRDLSERLDYLQNSLIPEGLEVGCDPIDIKLQQKGLSPITIVDLPGLINFGRTERYLNYIYKKYMKGNSFKIIAVKGHVNESSSLKCLEEDLQGKFPFFVVFTAASTYFNTFYHGYAQGQLDRDLTPGTILFFLENYGNNENVLGEEEEFQELREMFPTDFPNDQLGIMNLREGIKCKIAEYLLSPSQYRDGCRRMEESLEMKKKELNDLRKLASKDETLKWIASTIDVLLRTMNSAFTKYEVVAKWYDIDFEKTSRNLKEDFYLKCVMTTPAGEIISAWQDLDLLGESESESESEEDLSNAYERLDAAYRAQLKQMSLFYEKYQSTVYDFTNRLGIFQLMSIMYFPGEIKVLEDLAESLTAFLTECLSTINNEFCESLDVGEHAFLKDEFFHYVAGDPNNVKDYINERLHSILKGMYERRNIFPAAENYSSTEQIDGLLLKLYGVDEIHGILNKLKRFVFDHSERLKVTGKIAAYIGLGIGTGAAVVTAASAVPTPVYIGAGLGAAVLATDKKGRKILTEGAKKSTQIVVAGGRKVIKKSKELKAEYERAKDDDHRRTGKDKKKVMRLALKESKKHNPYLDALFASPDAFKVRTDMMKTMASYCAYRFKDVRVIIGEVIGEARALVTKEADCSLQHYFLKKLHSRSGAMVDEDKLQHFEARVEAQELEIRELEKAIELYGQLKKLAMQKR